MREFRLSGTLLGLGLFALAAGGCGQALEEGLPQNEALPNAPEGIVFLGEDDPLPPGYTIQALTAAEQTSMLAAVNATRTKGTSCGGVARPKAAALVSHTKLIQSAEAHAKDMADKNYFSHTGKDGSDPGVRIKRTGYDWSAYGENIAAGYATVADAVKGWYASTGHCNNFMNPGVTQVGFGKATNATSMYKTYWVAVLAKPR